MMLAHDPAIVPQLCIGLVPATRREAAIIV